MRIIDIVFASRSALRHYHIDDVVLSFLSTTRRRHCICAEEVVWMCACLYLPERGEGDSLRSTLSLIEKKTESKAI